MRINKHAELLKTGDKVTTDFYEGEEKIIRVIKDIWKSIKFGSGYAAIADGGDACPTCGRRSSGLGPIDASWFIPIEER